jgi:hypothetical protein
MGAMVTRSCSCARDTALHALNRWLAGVRVGENHGGARVKDDQQSVARFTQHNQAEEK